MFIFNLAADGGGSEDLEFAKVMQIDRLGKRETESKQERKTTQNCGEKAVGC